MNTGHVINLVFHKNNIYSLPYQTAIYNFRKQQLVYSCGNHQVLPLDTPKKVKLFIGINKSRSEYKGTDIMLKAAQAIAKKYPDKTELQIAENIPFVEYVK